jgi:hypothetical protein
VTHELNNIYFTRSLALFHEGAYCSISLRQQPPRRSKMDDLREILEELEKVKTLIAERKDVESAVCNEIEAAFQSMRGLRIAIEDTPEW